MASKTNPYASPALPTGTVLAADLADAESVRKAHARHELGVRQLGAVWYLFGLGGVLAAAAIPFVVVSQQRESINSYPTAVERGVGPMESFMLLFMAAFCIGFGAIYLATGWGTRRLLPWSRWALVGVSLFSMINPPFGTAVGAYGLYLALSQKAKVVFSPAYQQIMRETPHLRPKTSRIVAVLAALLIGLIFLAVIGFGLEILFKRFGGG